MIAERKKVIIFAVEKEGSVYAMAGRLITGTINQFIFKSKFNERY